MEELRAGGSDVTDDPLRRCVRAHMSTLVCLASSRARECHWCHWARVAGWRPHLLRSAYGLNPLTTIQTPIVSSHAAMGRVARPLMDETCSMTPKYVARNAASSRGAPTRPIVG